MKASWQRPCRVGLNLLHARPEIGGGWNYIANVVSALQEHDDHNEYCAFVTPASECLIREGKRMQKVRVCIPSRVQLLRVAWEHSLLQVYARTHRLDCMHWFGAVQGLVNAVPGLVTIYDLQPFLQYSKGSPVKMWVLRRLMAATVRGAAMLLPMSNATAEALELWLGADRSRMRVVPVIVDRCFTPQDVEEGRRLRVKYQLSRKFWLYVAHMYPHKNHIALLHALRAYKERGGATRQLVLRGDPKGRGAEIDAAIERLGLSADVRRLPALEGSELAALYSAAEAIVFPSLYEGAGIPLAEAMACGCPVLAADIAAARDLVGKGGTYFDQTDPAAIADALEWFEGHPEEVRRRRNVALERVGGFQSNVVAAVLIDAYETVARSGLRGASEG